MKQWEANRGPEPSAGRGLAKEDLGKVGVLSLLKLGRDLAVYNVRKSKLLAKCRQILIMFCSRAWLHTALGVGKPVRVGFAIERQIVNIF